MIHALYWTVGAVVAGHAVILMHVKHIEKNNNNTTIDASLSNISWHGILGYILLSLLAFQYLMGGRTISFTSRQWPTNSGTNMNQPNEHLLVQLHRTTGGILYVAFGVMLVTQLIVRRPETAILITLATLCTLFGVWH
jgi:Mn2+/Fe2+ NRAMP family transporter